jgi:hypothetical protein
LDVGSGAEASAVVAAAVSASFAFQARAVSRSSATIRDSLGSGANGGGARLRPCFNHDVPIDHAIHYPTDA